MAKNAMVAAMNTTSVMRVLGRRLRMNVEPPAPHHGCRGGQAARRHERPRGEDPEQAGQSGDDGNTSGADHQTSVGGGA
jgi:hypothetical protein